MIFADNYNNDNKYVFKINNQIYISLYLDIMQGLN